MIGMITHNPALSLAGYSNYQPVDSFSSVWVVFRRRYSMMGVRCYLA
jgi:hypothetical protein